jgi:glycosyltransferase involved in cell wall biosynthesis
MIESMGNGALIIASDLPSTREWITHKVTGLLCRSNRPIELARTIQWAFENPLEVEKIKNHAKSFAIENFTWDKQLCKLKNVYQKTLKY